MRATKKNQAQGRRTRRSAIFIDYENLYYLLDNSLDDDYADEVIAEMVDEFRRYLQDGNDTQTVTMFAYADFSSLHEHGAFVQRSLYLQGAEPRFVPVTLQDNAVEIQLSVDAMELLHHRQDIDTIALLTGDRMYLPLVQQFKRYGRQAVVAALAPPTTPDQSPYLDEGLFFDALHLLDENTRHSYLSAQGRPARKAEQAAEAPPADSPVERPSFQPLSDPVVLHALEIIEEHFGQYDEVYLTPLLRKFSEVLDEHEHDPKALISDLEACGVIHLEKRRGFPYDYTVLIVEDDHPDVQRIRQDLYDRAEARYEMDEVAYNGFHENGYADDLSARNDGQRGMMPKHRS